MNAFIVLAVLVCAEGAGLLFSIIKWRDARTEVAALIFRADQATLNFKALKATHDVTAESLGSCLGEVKVAQNEQAKALLSVEQLSRHIRETTTSERTHREIIYREPSCQELGELDIAAVCPDLAVSLRARSAGMSAP